MIPRLLELGVPVIWRAHIGLDLPNESAREAWRFLLPYVEPADAYVFSRPAYAWEGLDRGRVSVIAPSIDAFSPKNHGDGVHERDRGAARGRPRPRTISIRRGLCSSGSTARRAA